MEKETHCEIRVCSMRHAIAAEGRKGVLVVNATSRSRAKWALDFSPFYLGKEEGGFDLYREQESGRMLRALNLENAWQFAKCHLQHVEQNEAGDYVPNAAYWEWAKEGWADEKAHRWPLGKGHQHPVYSWWDGRPYSYVESRKAVYAPLYAKLVQQTAGYRKLARMIASGEYWSVWLRDFDGYDHVAEGMSFQEVLHHEQRPMGHAFVLAMCLSGQRVWEETAPVALGRLQVQQRVDYLKCERDGRKAPSGAVQRSQPERAASRRVLSCGFLIRSRGAFLLLHAASGGEGDHDGHLKEKKWTIPKGMQEEGETELDTAVRELYEETGIDLIGEQELHPLVSMWSKPSFVYRLRRKEVHVFFIDDVAGALRNRKKPLQCTSLIGGPEAPPHLCGLPECDDFAWVESAEKCAEMVFSSQERGIFRSKRFKDVVG